MSSFQVFKVIFWLFKKKMFIKRISKRTSQSDFPFQRVSPSSIVYLFLFSKCILLALLSIVLQMNVESIIYTQMFSSTDNWFFRLSIFRSMFSFKFLFFFHVFFHFFSFKQDSELMTHTHKKRRAKRRSSTSGCSFPHPNLESILDR